MEITPGYRTRSPDPLSFRINATHVSKGWCFCAYGPDTPLHLVSFTSDVTTANLNVLNGSSTTVEFIAKSVKKYRFLLNLLLQKWKNAGVFEFSMAKSQLVMTWKVKRR